MDYLIDQKPQLACNISLDIDVYTYHTNTVAPPNKVMYSLRLDPAHARLLKQIKARDGIPESEQIRRGLLLWFAQKGVLKKKTTRKRKT